MNGAGRDPGLLAHSLKVESVSLCSESDALGGNMPRSVNRTFTKPETRRPPVSIPNSFEQIVKELNISPGEYRSSSELKEWVRRYKDERYVPPELLEAFGFRVDV